MTAPIDCPDCYGHGAVVTSSSVRRLDGYVSEREERCETCDGAGTVDSAACANCGEEVDVAELEDGDEGLECRACRDSYAEQVEAEADELDPRENDDWRGAVARSMRGDG